MKLQYRINDLPVITAFLKEWIKNAGDLEIGLLFSDGCDPLFFDCDEVELQNCFMELSKKGATQSIKEIYQGNIFYRSDTGKCPRCRRHRPEIHWNNENLKECDADLCDRCTDFMKTIKDKSN